MRVAIYGGSFNPIHTGHLLAAEYVCENLNYDKIVFIPAFLPVHKDNSKLIEGRHRLTMINKAIKNYNYFSSSDIELRRGGKTYTIDTIIQFKKENKISGKIGLIIGDDLLPGLNKWKDIYTLQDICDIICLGRNGKVNTDFKINYLSNRIIELSSTEIRNRVSENKNIDFMIPLPVKKYIMKNKLYI